MKKKTVLLTGASGFIGKAVLKELIREKKYKVIAVTTNKEKLLLDSIIGAYKDEFVIVEVDLMDFNAVSVMLETYMPDEIIHLAWKLEGGDAFQKSAENLDWLECSLNLIRLFVQMKGKRFVFAGSSSEYAFSDEKLEESMQMIPLNLYGRCKKAISEIGYEFCMQNDVSFVTARFFSVYGENDFRRGRAILGAIEKFQYSQIVECNMPHNLWDYIYVEDAAKATVKLLQSNYSGIVNISSGNGIEMGEVFRIIARLMDKEEFLLLHEESGEKRCLVGDNNRMEQQLGYHNEMGLEKGLKKTIEWFLGRL